MKPEITIKVTDGEKTIEFPWELLKENYKNFMVEQSHYTKLEETILRIVESRIRCVFFDIYQKHLIQ